MKGAGKKPFDCHTRHDRLCAKRQAGMVLLEDAKLDQLCGCDDV